jgi:hypothetical protein
LDQDFLTLEFMLEVVEVGYIVELEEQLVQVEEEQEEMVEQQVHQEQLIQVGEVEEQEMVLHQDQAVQESLS